MGIPYINCQQEAGSKDALGHILSAKNIRAWQLRLDLQLPLRNAWLPSKKMTMLCHMSSSIMGHSDMHTCSPNWSKYRECHSNMYDVPLFVPRRRTTCIFFCERRINMYIHVFDWASWHDKDFHLAKLLYLWKSERLTWDDVHTLCLMCPCSSERPQASEVDVFLRIVDNKRIISLLANSNTYHYKNNQCMMDPWKTISLIS